MKKIIPLNFVDEVKNPVLGEIYLATCIVYTKGKEKHYTPVIDHPHNDIENGQKETHYHYDTRFSYREENAKNLPENYRHHACARPEPKENSSIEYLPLILENFWAAGTTMVVGIRNSKLKHDCIYKGKCPHRGYDLSNVPPYNGQIICPLHGLRFDAETLKLIPVEQYS